MSLLNTKPRWFTGECVATERGWVNPKNNEVLVSIGNLKAKLEAETQPVPVKIEPQIIVAEPEIVIKEVKQMETEEKQKKPQGRKPKVIGEVTESKIPANQQLIGEVVEYDLNTTKVIGE